MPRVSDGAGRDRPVSLETAVARSSVALLPVGVGTARWRAFRGSCPISCRPSGATSAVSWSPLRRLLLPRADRSLGSSRCRELVRSCPDPHAPAARCGARSDPRRGRPGWTRSPRWVRLPRAGRVTLAVRLRCAAVAELLARAPLDRPVWPAGAAGVPLNGVVRRRRRGCLRPDRAVSETFVPPPAFRATVSRAAWPARARWRCWRPGVGTRRLVAGVASRYPTVEACLSDSMPAQQHPRLPAGLPIGCPPMPASTHLDRARA